ncbi:uncharacterized protein LOC123307870 [Coccinella septempunctata]|uniref:uncharacterized protein LOC123307870 n=1 Tax=Coccinella septempunctata TaxID=41139 RepID=UPI001D060DBC|nr:uncharacterized protein LOC123307870 [Coccinella septempunctata]
MRIDSFFGHRDSNASADLPNERKSISRRMKRFLNYKRDKWWSYIICLITFVITLTVGFLALLSKTSLYYVLFRSMIDMRGPVLILILILDFWIFCFNAALFYGIKYKNAVLIFVWIITMLVNWNIYVFARLIHLVDKAMDEEIELKDLYVDIVHLYFNVGFWLLMISIIWDYWQTISNITDIPELIDFLAQWHARSHMPSAGESSSLPDSEFTTPRTSRFAARDY